MAKGKKTGGGSRKGVPNKVTADARACMVLVSQGFAPEVLGLLRKGAKKDPLGACRTFAQLLEFNLPKLSRTELSTGTDTLKIEIVDPTRRDPASQ